MILSKPPRIACFDARVASHLTPLPKLSANQVAPSPRVRHSGDPTKSTACQQVLQSAGRECDRPMAKLRQGWLMEGAPGRAVSTASKSGGSSVNLVRNHSLHVHMPQYDACCIIAFRYQLQG